MKKLLSIILLTASYNFILFPIIPKNKNNTYLKFDKNEKIWKMCTEINNDEAECINVNKYIDEIILTIFDYSIPHENKIKALLKDMAIAQTKYHYLTLKMHLENSQKEQNLSKEEQQTAHLGFEKLDAKFKDSLSLSILQEWINKHNDPEYIRSILSKEEQKMLDAIEEMSIKLKEKAENKN